ncbi:vesicle-associated protein 1-2 isoform X2 [Daucus carota subsp. sativus]|uniref:vesicle-associated protein 1-2 isoform X2 n=1 Tax=Daucus carota subsp. sativus TaxID=79200 RepID=UPI003083A09C
MNTNPFSPLAEYSYSDELIDRDELISIDPQRVYFMYELNKPMLSSFQLSNDSDEYVAFRVKTTNLKKYSVQPRKVTMQALKEEPSVLRCLDDFLVQCVAVPAGATVQDVTPEIFNNEAGNRVEEYKLKPDYNVRSESEESEEETSENTAAVSAGFSDYQITSTKFDKEAGHHVEEFKSQAASVASPVPEDSEETSENDTSVSGGSSDHEIASTKADNIISSLTNEKQSNIQENNGLLMEPFKDLMSMLAKDPNSSRTRSKRLQDEVVKALISTFTSEKLLIIQENAKLKDKLVKDIMLMLTEEKQSIIQDINSRLKEEVELLKRDLTRNKGGSRLSIYYLLLIAVLSILLVHIFGSLMLSSDFS